MHVCGSLHIVALVAPAATAFAQGHFCEVHQVHAGSVAWEIEPVSQNMVAIFVAKDPHPGLTWTSCLFCVVVNPQEERTPAVTFQTFVSGTHECLKKRLAQSHQPWLSHEPSRMGHCRGADLLHESRIMHGEQWSWLGA